MRRGHGDGSAPSQVSPLRQTWQQGQSAAVSNEAAGSPEAAAGSQTDLQMCDCSKAS